MDTNVLLHALRSRTAVPNDEYEEYLSMCEQRSYKKNEHLCKEGDIPRSNAFIVKGCIRSYYIGENGTERTTILAEEGYWIGDIESMRNQLPTKQNIQALEDCDVITIARDKWEIAYETYEWFAKIHTLEQQRRAAKMIDHVGRLLTETPEANYLKLIQDRPTLIQRVPQYYIASYLGISAETLSRVRKKLSGL